jgi:hypothetical protein
MVPGYSLGAVQSNLVFPPTAILPVPDDGAVEHGVVVGKKLWVLGTQP